MRAGRLARSAVRGARGWRVALSLAALSLLTACDGGTGAGTATDDGKAAGTALKAPPANAVDPDLNWGGTTPHDLPPPPPPRDVLLTQADEVLRKAVPDFDRFMTQYAKGDLDGDGDDDVVIEYGIGDEGAMRHVAKSVRVLLARDAGSRLELQPDQSDVFEYCPAIREIRDRQLFADGLEACMLPFPATLAYYRFEWRDGALHRLSREEPEERVLSRLRDMRKALLAGNIAQLARNLADAPAAGLDQAGAAPPSAASSASFLADAGHRRGFVDTIGQLGEKPLRRANDNERLAESPGGKRSLHVLLTPEASPIESEDSTYRVEAQVTLTWPEGEQVGYQTTWRLIEGDLYLQTAEVSDLSAAE